MEQLIIKKTKILLIITGLLLAAYLMTGCGGGLGLGSTVLDLIDPEEESAPEPAAELDLSKYGNCAYALADGNRVYVAMRSQGVAIVNIEDPENPSYITSYDTEGEAWKVYKEGDYLYVASDEGGYYILNVSQSDAPVLVGREDPSGYNNIISLHKSGNYLYWCGGTAEEGYFGIADVTDPNSPSSIKIVDLPDNKAGVSIWVEGDFLYLGDYAGNLHIYNISNPQNPILTKKLTLATEDTLANSIFKSGDYIYLSNWLEGLMIVDVNTPQLPQHLSTFTWDNPAYDCEIDDIHAYIAFGRSGLLRINISDPSQPKDREILTNPDDSLIRSVSLYGNYAYLADGARDYLLIVKCE